ncbi:hypothetical protein QYM36_008409 [Artemia franciscana]|nr:hypothetical protein QYM36_008409 [Artemia franciscana]
MADDEKLTIRKDKRVHYGSMEEKIKAGTAQVPRQPVVALTTGSTSPTVDLSDSGMSEEEIEEPSKEQHIYVSSEYLPMEKRESEDKIQALAEFERRKKAREIKVSTDDKEVKRYLRQIGEPICLFGEGPADRRNRLRELLSVLGEDAIIRKEEDEEKKAEVEREKETWFHEGPDSLKISRLYIAEYSLPKAKARLEKSRAEQELPEATKNGKIQEIIRRMQTVNISGSQIGDSRPISYCTFSPNGEYILTASWSGLCKLWSLPDIEMVQVYRGHDINVGAIEFHPQSTKSVEPTDVNMASCSHDGTVKLWSLESDEPIANIEGSAPFRVSRIKFHPSGRFLATCVHDSSWRMWDLVQLEEVLHQEGHSGPVYCIAYHPDGSLAVTG